MVINSISISDEGIFASEPFTFIVQGKPYYAYTALIADCSEPLNCMINGHLSEAQQDFALFKDVAEETFVLFIRWAYNRLPCGRVPPGRSWKRDQREQVGIQATKEARVNDDLDEWGTWALKQGKKNKMERRSEPKRSLRESFIEQQDTFLGEDCTEVFLGLARLYVFAEEYGIQPLKNVALEKLLHTLSVFTLYPERVGDITALLRYVYANTAETIAGTDDIRTMLAHYIVTEMGTLIKSGEIMELMLEDGELLGNFLKMFALRVT